MKRNIILILIITGLLGGLLLYMDRQKPVGFVERNGQGEGKKAQEFEVYVDGKKMEQSLQMDVEEEAYTAKELQRAFEEVMDKLDTIVLGENESFDRVETDLVFVSGVEDYPMYIRWQLDSYDVLGADGKIQEERTKEEGTLVNICGILTYEQGGQEALYQRAVRVYPKTLGPEESLRLKIEKLLKETEKEKRTEGSFALPSQIEGKAIRFERRADKRGYMVMLLGVVATILVPVWKKEKEREQEKKRREQLLVDYPKMIGNFTMLLDTGMTVKNVWEKMVKQYETERTDTGRREVYEEMAETFYEMKGGIAEADAYERFGRRIGISEYRKFAALLLQSLKKGTRGMSQLLYMEALQAAENRKNRAKRKAEEAGTKLLVPMFVMLGVVIVIIVVPAFLSMKL